LRAALTIQSLLALWPALAVLAVLYRMFLKMALDTFRNVQINQRSQFRR
jgi:hypothetical protein